MLEYRELCRNVFDFVAKYDMEEATQDIKDHAALL